MNISANFASISVVKRFFSQLALFSVLFILFFVQSSFGQSASSRFELWQGAFFNGGDISISEHFSLVSGVSDINGSLAYNSNTILQNSFSPSTTSSQPIFIQPFSETQKPDDSGNITVQVPDVVPHEAKITLLAHSLTVKDNLPDLQIADGGITVTGNPTEGNLVYIYATINNTGYSKATNFTVSFYAGDPRNGGLLIGVDLVRQVIESGGSGYARLQWNTENISGKIRIYVSIDLFNKLAEGNKLNNISFHEVSVLTKADLAIDTADISFSNPSPMLGESITISAKIHNNGQTDATGALVEFYLGNPDIDGQILGTNLIDVPAGNSTLSEFLWKPAKAGSGVIFVSANRDQLISEPDYSTNTANKTITVSTGEIYIDCGNDTKDPEYTVSNGYGYLNGFPVEDWGKEPYKTVRFSLGDTIQYQFDNLDPLRYYHLDFSFYEGDNITREGEVLIDGIQTSDPFKIDASPKFLSFDLPKASYIDDGSVIVSVKRVGTGNIVVSELRLIPVQKVMIDSGSPDDFPYSIERGYGYLTGDPSSDWGVAWHETIRFAIDGDIRYQFDNLSPEKRYQLVFTFFEGDNSNRKQEVYIDGAYTGVTVLLGDREIHVPLDVPQTSYEMDKSIIVSIKKTQGIGAIISGITLEEVTTLNSNANLLGDINGDNIVDLKDAVLALKVLSRPDLYCDQVKNSNQNCASGIRINYQTAGVDVNGDNRVGMHEVLYILQKLAKLRE